MYIDMPATYFLTFIMKQEYYIFVFCMHSHNKCIHDEPVNVHQIWLLMNRVGKKSTTHRGYIILVAWTYTFLAMLITSSSCKIGKTL